MKKTTHSKTVLTRLTLGVALCLPLQQMLSVQSAIAAGQDQIPATLVQPAESLMREATIALMLMDQNQSTQAIDDYLSGKVHSTGEKITSIAGGIVMAAAAVSSILILKDRLHMKQGPYWIGSPETYKWSLNASLFAATAVFSAGAAMTGGAEYSAYDRKRTTQAAMIQAINSDVKIYGQVLGKTKSQQVRFAQVLRDRLEQASVEHPVSIVELLVEKNWISAGQGLKLKKSQELVRAAISKKSNPATRAELKAQLKQVSDALDEVTRMESPRGGHPLSGQQKDLVGYLRKSIEFLIDQMNKAN